jgi:hypothetical protein
MTSLSIGPVRRWRRFAGLFAVLLVLAGIIPTYAASGGVVNGSFGTASSCSLAGWTSSTTGPGLRAVSVAQENISERTSCAATIAVTTGLAEETFGQKAVLAGDTNGFSLSPAHTTATLEQRFLVTTKDETKPVLNFFIEPHSNRPGTTYMAQKIALYNSAGQLIYQRSRNTENGSEGYPFYRFKYDLTAYVDQYVTLRITSQIDPSVPESPTTVSLTIDFDCPALNSGVCGDGNPGGNLPGEY